MIKFPFFQGKKRYARIRLAWRRLSPRSQQKSQDLRLVSVNGLRLKRLTLHDSHLASAIEHNLEAFETSPHFPSLIFRHENRLWIEFIDGNPIQDPDETTAEHLAAVYANLYKQDSQQIVTHETPFLKQLYRDLRFLHQVALLRDSAYGELMAAAQRLMPPKVWVGFDYTDPGFKNFVLLPNRSLICAIDVESLQGGQLLGTGLAKARLSWPSSFWKVFYRQLFAQLDTPELQSCLPFVELCSLARWTKKKILIDKGKAVDFRHFERFRTLSNNGTPTPDQL